MVKIFVLWIYDYWLLHLCPNLLIPRCAPIRCQLHESRDHVSLTDDVPLKPRTPGLQKELNKYQLDEGVSLPKRPLRRNCIKVFLIAPFTCSISPCQLTSSTARGLDPDCCFSQVHPFLVPTFWFQYRFSFLKACLWHYPGLGEISSSLSWVTVSWMAMAPLYPAPSFPKT